MGAFGFGYRLSLGLPRSMDWLGIVARAQNRGRVVGLSRFLIRPGLRAPNLASQCYGLVLRQVRRDWQERYGVQPELVETYVDRAHHLGKSLAAANWRRLGSSAGRGRDDPQRRQSQSPKDVWVYELDPRRAGTCKPSKWNGWPPVRCLRPHWPPTGWSRKWRAVQLGINV